MAIYLFSCVDLLARRHTYRVLAYSHVQAYATVRKIRGYAPLVAMTVDTIPV